MVAFRTYLFHTGLYMKNDVLDLEPLVAHLSPFGNPYEIDDWTPEMRHAARNFLLYWLSDDAYAEILDKLGFQVPNVVPSEQQVDLILAECKPWLVAIAAHFVAVRMVPSLEQLLQVLVSATDVMEWLKRHATREQLAAVIQELDPSYPPLPAEHFGSGVVLWLSEQQPAPKDALLSAWRRVVAQDKAKVETKPSIESIRTWAREHGYQVSDRGRLPREVVTAFRKAQGQGK